MVSYITTKKDPTSHLLFPVIQKVKISIGELIGVNLYQGKNVIGIVDEICSDKEHFWIRASNDLNAYRERCSFKLDQVVKLS
jgi:hypothetical protein